MPEKEYKPTEELEAKEGYIKDFLTNRLIRLTPEEQVRQIMLMRLVQEYEYPKEWIKTEFEIQKGSKRIGPADIVLPKSATLRCLSQWLISLGFKERFPERVNIGEIPTGTVKSTIDCLFPIIGGKEGAPEDWRIDELLVERQSGYNNLRIKIFGRSF